MSVFPEPEDEYSDVQQQADQGSESASTYGAVLAWAVGLAVAAVAAVVAIWQVNEQIYTPQYAAEQYWQSITQGDGAGALSHFSAVPDLAEDESTDHVLLDGEPLARSAELIEDARLEADSSSAQLLFTAGAEDFTSEVPLTHQGTSWVFFDEWGLAEDGLTAFDVEVPGAPQGGIGQVQVNDAAVNLDEEIARLSAFVPTVAELSVESQWLTGRASQVVTAPEGSSDSVQKATVELEASDEASELLHQELDEYFESCDQQVLMPTGCPVGLSTPHRVDAGTISWSFPEPEEFSLGFDAEGWQVEHGDLVAEVSFEATHHHTGEALTETEQVAFELDVSVGASGDDLIVSVRSG